MQEMIVTKAFAATEAFCLTHLHSAAGERFGSAEAQFSPHEPVMMHWQTKFPPPPVPEPLAQLADQWALLMQERQWLQSALLLYAVDAFSGEEG